MEHLKQCPYCAELVNAKALICRYCQSMLGGGAVEKKGEPVKVRIKTRDKIYIGDIFLPQHLERVSDVINDTRHFIVLTDAREETKASEAPIGILALNKAIIEWVRFIGYK